MSVQMLPIADGADTVLGETESLKRTARIAGLLYLLLGVGSGFAYSVDQRLFGAEDAARLVETIRTSAAMLHLGLASNVVGMVSFLLLANVLHDLLSRSDESQARLMVIFVIAGVSIACVNVIIQLAAIHLVNGEGAPIADGREQHALVAMLIEMYRQGAYVAGLFWGLWLLPFGLLVFKSDFFPKVLGVLLMASCFGYLINSTVFLFFPRYSAIASPGIALAATSEIACIAWLLIKGVRT